MSHGKKYINPLAMKNVTGPPLSGAVLADFRNTTSQWLAMMEHTDRIIAMKNPPGNHAFALLSSPQG